MGKDVYLLIENNYFNVLINSYVVIFFCLRLLLLLLMVFKVIGDGLFLLL